MANWRDLIMVEMEKHKENWDDIVSTTMTNGESSVEFNAYWEEGIPFTVWTKKRVYFPVCYDGSEWVGSVSRDPDGIPTTHMGG